MLAASRSAVDVNVHRIGEAVARMEADRDFKDPALGIDIAAQDPQHRTAALEIERLGNIGAGGNSLDILRDLADADPGQLLDLLNRVPAPRSSRSTAASTLS